MATLADDRANRGVWLGLVALAAITGITFIRYNPPAPRAVSAPPSEFSAARAQNVLFQLVGDGVPHPIGSPENFAVRERIVDILRRIGYEPEIQTGFGCDSWGTCGTVRNIVARLDGKEAGSAVLLAAHYDSVPAGPGASDDGVGVATVLEIARVLKTAAPPQHTIFFLIDDGEEAGMLGAESFVADHPLARDVKAAVNIEARGTSGPSLMFETGDANAWVVDLFARMASHPITNSIYYSVYNRLPNDTDFTIFRLARYQGLNFAIIGDVTHYHTPLDNFEYASESSLQHQGDNALAAILSLANADLENPPIGDSVYFDIFGKWLVGWRERASFPIAATIAFFVLIEIALLLRRHALSISRFLWGGIGWAAIVIVTGAIGYALLAAYRFTGAMPPRGAEFGWIAHPIIAEVAFGALAFACVFTIVRILHKRAGFWGFWSAGNAIFAVAAIEASRVFPGASFVFIVPTAGAVAGALEAVLDTKNREWLREITVVAWAIFTFSIFLPSIWFLYTALGDVILPGIAILLALMLAVLSPAIASADEATQQGLGNLAGLVTIIAAAIAFAVPAYSIRAPQRVNFQYWLDGDAHRGKWLAGTNSQRLPDWLAAAANFKKQPQTEFPWEFSPRFSADAPSLDMAPPELTVVGSETTQGVVRYHIRVASPRGAPKCTVFLPPSSGVSGIEIGGQMLPKPFGHVLPYLDYWLHGWKMMEDVTMPAEGVDISFNAPNAAPLEAYVIDESYALPTEGAFLRTARPADATTSDDGDTTIVSRRVEIRPLPAEAPAGN
jgi:Peptidase family M28